MASDGEATVAARQRALCQRRFAALAQDALGTHGWRELSAAMSSLRERAIKAPQFNALALRLFARDSRMYAHHDVVDGAICDGEGNLQ